MTVTPLHRSLNSNLFTTSTVLPLTMQRPVQCRVPRPPSSLGQNPLKKMTCRARNRIYNSNSDATNHTLDADEMLLSFPSLITIASLGSKRKMYVIAVTSRRKKDAWPYSLSVSAPVCRITNLPIWFLEKPRAWNGPGIPIHCFSANPQCWQHDNQHLGSVH